MPDIFDDLLVANRRYAETFPHTGLLPGAAKGLAVLTCVDSRIEPLQMLGLAPGDAKILRNAGARVTPDALRSLILVVNLLDVSHLCVVQHTGCAVASADEAHLHDQVRQACGKDTAGWEFMAIEDQRAVVRSDIEVVRSCPLLSERLVTGGFIYDVQTGLLDEVVRWPAAPAS